MSDNDSRILHGFSDRLAIERAVKDLANARNAYQQDQQAKALAARGKDVLRALLRHLEASDPTLRGGLGRLAQHMDPNLVIPALQQAAMDERRSDAARLTAVMLLERYLGQEIDPIMAQRIPASYDVARESGEEAIAIAETEPLVLVEYAEQLLDEPPEIVHAVLQVITDMEDPRRARLLQAVAAYAEPDLQREILTILGSIRHPLAVQALHVLWRLVAPDLKDQARRQIQKLRLSGVKEESTSDLRALWSPINAQGHSFLWFVHSSAEAPLGDLLVLILHDELGVVYATAYPQLDPELLPRPAARGKSNNIPMVDSSHRVLMVEIDPLLGLQMLDEALTRMAQLQFPWPGEIVVFGDWLWTGRPYPLPDPLWPKLPQPAFPEAETAKSLLEHPAFSGWVWTLPDLNVLLRDEDRATLQKNGTLHRRIAAMLVNETNRKLLSQRLLQQARWLTLSKDRKTAAQTLGVRENVNAGAVDHPFIEMLAWRSLLTAAADQAMRHALQSISRIEEEDTPPNRRPTTPA